MRGHVDKVVKRNPNLVENERLGEEREFLPEGWKPMHAGVPRFAPSEILYETFLGQINRRRSLRETDTAIRQSLGLRKVEWEAWIPPRSAYTGGAHYAFTDREREMVINMSSTGITHKEIAGVLGINYSTLVKHFRKELDHAKIKRNEMVTNALFVNATRHNNVSAQMFWLKANAGWDDKAQPQVTTNVNTNLKVTLGGRKIVNGQLVSEIEESQED